MEKDEFKYEKRFLENGAVPSQRTKLKLKLEQKPRATEQLWSGNKENGNAVPPIGVVPPRVDMGSGTVLVSVFQPILQLGRMVNVPLGAILPQAPQPVLLVPTAEQVEVIKNIFSNVAIPAFDLEAAPAPPQPPPMPAAAPAPSATSSTSPEPELVTISGDDDSDSDDDPIAMISAVESIVVKEQVKEQDDDDNDATDNYPEGIADEDVEMDSEDETSTADSRYPGPRLQFKCPVGDCTHDFWTKCGYIICDHLENCPELQKVREENESGENETGGNGNTTTETLLFIHCPFCNDFSTSLEDKLGFVDHVEWCGARIESKWSPKPMKYRVFLCESEECRSKNIKYLTLQYFIAHNRNHRKYAYKCHACPTRFKSAFADSSILKSHWKDQHPDIPVPAAKTRLVRDPFVPTVPQWCPVCNLRFKDEAQCDSHLKSAHTSSSNFQRTHKCEKCPSSFFFADELHLHQNTFHLDEAPRFKCNLCSETFRYKEDMKKHTAATHKEEVPKEKVACHLCGKLVKPSSLKSHIRVVHEGQKQKKIEFCKTCDFCGKEFRNKLNYRVHLTRAHPDDPHEDKADDAHFFECPVSNCSWKIWKRRKESITKHMRSHEGSTYTCQFCPRSFTSDHGLQHHEKFHENWEQFPFKCDHCSMGFGTGLALNVHFSKFHLNAKERNGGFPCPIPSCEKTFSLLDALRKHLSDLHRPSGVYPTCPKCGAKQTGKKNLYLHLARQHGVEDLGKEGEGYVRRCPAENCKKVFSRWEHKLFEWHMTKHNGKGPQFECEPCQKKFFYPRALRLHRKKVHGIEEEDDEEKHDDLN